MVSPRVAVSLRQSITDVRESRHARGPHARLWCAVLLLGTWGTACTGDQPGDARAMTPGTRARDSAAAVKPAYSLARAAGGSDARTYSGNAPAAAGTVAGRVTGTAPASDTTIVPTHDLRACARFTQALYPASDGGIGDAVVWLSGVAAGRANDTPRRVTLTMRDCRLSPRVVRVATGGTVILNSHDAIMLRLRFLDTDAPDSVRAIVATNDEGQVVPISDATRAAGIVAVRDDLHPWVRAYLAVAPHPYVAVTEADGRFAFEGVPPGTYTLVVWHERFGTTTQPVTVSAGQATRADLPVR
jgi:hypothetical protein